MVLAMAPKITVSEMIHDAVTANMYLLQLRFFSEEKEKNKYYWKITVKRERKNIVYLLENQRFFSNFT